MGRVSYARERLISAAIDLIWSSSYGAVSVDALCERAETKKGSFYHFFDSKDALVVAALDAHWQARKPVLDELFENNRSPLQRLDHYFDHVYKRQCELRQKYGLVVGCLHASIGTECIRHSPAIEAKVQEILAEYVAYYERALRDAKHAGDISIKDPAAGARAIFAFMEGVLGQARIANDVELIRGLGKNARLLLGINTKARRSDVAG